MNVVFIVLHYKDTECTINSVESILNINHGMGSRILIIENGSQDNSYKLLSEYFYNKGNITVVANEKNLGFAKGNNVGYTIAKEMFEADFMVFINNDVIIEQTNFIETLIMKFNLTQYYVLGPDIVSKRTGRHQSPIGEALPTLEKIQKTIAYHENFLRYPIFYFLKWNFSKLNKALNLRIKKFLNKFNVNPDNLFDAKYFVEKEESILHGACLIFSPLYIRMNNYAFYPETFLYYEEQLLSLRCKINNWKILYSPDLCVTHLEDVSTNTIVHSEYSKRKFIFHHRLNSLRIYEKLIISIK